MNSKYTTDPRPDSEKLRSEQLREEVLQDIHKVNNDMDAIIGRLTPGQLLDDAIYSHGSKNPNDTFEYLKSNPLGTTLITLGALCLMEDEQHQSYGKKIMNKAQELTEENLHKAQDQIHSKVHQAQDKMHDIQHRVQDKIQTAKHKKESVGFEDVGLGEGMDVEGIGSKVRHTKDQVSARIQDTRERFREELLTTERKIKGRAEETIERAKHLDPMTYLALGAGLGTITGAALPVSDKENEFISSHFESEFSEFRNDLEFAINKSVNILKNEIIGGLTETNIRLF